MYIQEKQVASEQSCLLRVPFGSSWLMFITLRVQHLDKNQPAQLKQLVYLVSYFFGTLIRNSEK